MNSNLVVFSILKRSYHSFSIFFFHFSFFSSLCYLFIYFLCFSLFSVKTPAKSVWWAVWLGPRRGPWHQLIWGLCCCRHRVQTNSHGTPGCGTPFSVSPRGPSLPPGSRPALSWHRSGSYPSNWQEKTQQVLTPQAYDFSGRLVLNWMHHLVEMQSQEWKSSQNLAPQKTEQGKSLWRHSRWSSYFQ